MYRARGAQSISKGPPMGVPWTLWDPPWAVPEHKKTDYDHTNKLNCF